MFSSAGFYRLMKKSPACNKVSYYLLKMGSICLFSLCSYVFSLCCAQFCYYRLVHSNFCYVWKLLSFYFEKSLFIDKMFQCLWTTLLIFGRHQLSVNISGIFVSFEVVLPLSFKSLFLSIFSTAFLYVYLLVVVNNLVWQTSVWASHNRDWSNLVYCRSIGFWVLDYMKYHLLVI